MISKKGFIGLVSVTGIVLIGAIVTTQTQQRSEPSNPFSGQLLLPELSSRINDATQIKITSGENTIAMEKKADGWVLTSRSDYPADVSKIRQLLVGLTQLTVIEPKTNNPELFEKLGTVDPAPGKPSVLVDITAAAGTTLASLIVGNQAPARAATGRTEYYTRNKGASQNFLVEGNLFLGKSTAEWLNKQITNIENQRIAEVSVTHNDGIRVTVKKEKPDQTDFTAIEPKDHGSTKSQFALNSVGTTLAHLSIQDVLKAEEMDLTKPNLEARLKTYDGLTITAKIIKKDSKSYATLNAAYNANTQPLSSPNPAGANEASKNPPPDPATVQKEAEELAKTLTPWVFEIPSFQVESLGKRPVDLFETPATNGKKK